MPSCRLLPAVEFIYIRRTNPMARMRAALPVVGRNVRTFDVKAIHRLARGKTVLGARQVPESGAHIVRTAGNHRGIETRHSRREQHLDRARDLLVRSCGRVVVHAGEAVHLHVDPSRTQIDAGRSRAGLNRLNFRVEFQLEGRSGCYINALQ